MIPTEVANAETRAPMWQSRTVARRGTPMPPTPSPAQAVILGRPGQLSITSATTQLTLSGPPAAFAAATRA